MVPDGAADVPGAVAAPAVVQDLADDPAHAPIDCPLRRHGIDPSNLRPFEEIEIHIAFLDRPDREAWQKPDEVVAALGLTGPESVGDLGAGSGYLTFRFSTALPRGKVVTIDIEPGMVRHIHHQAMSRGLTNVEAVLADAAAGPSIPATADIVFVCDVLHHVANRKTWLARLSAEMKVGARLVLIEFREGPLPEGPPESVKLPHAVVLDLTSSPARDSRSWRRPARLPAVPDVHDVPEAGQGHWCVGLLTQFSPCSLPSPVLRSSLRTGENDAKSSSWEVVVTD